MQEKDCLVGRPLWKTILPLTLLVIGGLLGIVVGVIVFKSLLGFIGGLFGVGAAAGVAAGSVRLS